MVSYDVVRLNVMSYVCGKIRRGENQMVSCVVVSNCITVGSAFEFSTWLNGHAAICNYPVTKKRVPVFLLHRFHRFRFQGIFTGYPGTRVPVH